MKEKNNMKHLKKYDKYSRVDENLDNYLIAALAVTNAYLLLPKAYSFIKYQFEEFGTELKDIITKIVNDPIISKYIKDGVEFNFNSTDENSDEYLMNNRLSNILTKEQIKLFKKHIDDLQYRMHLRKSFSKSSNETDSEIISDEDMSYIKQKFIDYVDEKNYSRSAPIVVGNKIQCKVHDLLNRPQQFNIVVLSLNKYKIEMPRSFTSNEYDYDSNQYEDQNHKKFKERKPVFKTIEDLIRYAYNEFKNIDNN